MQSTAKEGAQICAVNCKLRVWSAQSTAKLYAVNCKMEDGMSHVLVFLAGVLVTWKFVHWITENGWYEIVEPKKGGQAE